MASSPSYDRCAGALLGLTAGDALAAGYRLQVRPSGEASMKGGGLGGWEPGEWTDDTQMAICIAEETATGTVEPVRRGRTVSRAVPARDRLMWVSKPVRSFPIRRTPTGWPPVRSTTSGRIRTEAGNGSLMRTAPLASYASLGDDKRLVGSRCQSRR